MSSIPRLRLALLVTPVFTPDTSTLRAVELLAGPLIGHTTPTSTRVWVETSEPADVRIDYWLKPRLWYDGPTLPKPVHLGSAAGRTTVDVPHTAVVELGDLPPGWMMNYTVRLNGRPVRALSTQSVFLMPPTAPDSGAARAAPAFSVASTPRYAIWDDHDFGPNNSDRTFPYRGTTLELFRRYWPNPDSSADVLRLEAFGDSALSGRRLRRVANAFLNG